MVAKILLIFGYNQCKPSFDIDMDPPDFNRANVQRVDCDGRSEDQPADSKSPRAKSTSLAYQPPKTFKRSTSGCMVCRTRRKKVGLPPQPFYFYLDNPFLMTPMQCDETRPSCGRCRIRGFQCIYKSPVVYQRHYRELMRARNASPTSDAFSMSLASTAKDITSLLQSAAGPGTMLVNTADSTFSRESLQALARFELFTANTLGSPIIRHVARNDVLRLGFKVRIIPLTNLPFLLLLLLQAGGADFEIISSRPTSCMPSSLHP